MPNDETTAKKRVLLADDHPLMRQGIAQLIQREPDLEVVAQAESVDEALQAVERHRPDIVVTDFSFRQSNGLELIKDIQIRRPGTPVLVLTMHSERYYAQRVLRAGARGFLTKSEPPHNVIAAIRAVLAGRIYVSQKMAMDLVGKMVGASTEQPGLTLENLSDREFEIFELIGKGVEVREIAKQFHLSVKTIETHRDNIRKKLGFDTSNELLKHAIQWFNLESCGS